MKGRVPMRSWWKPRKSCPGPVPRYAIQASSAVTGVGLGVPTVGDADELAAGHGVGLGLADADEQVFGLGFDVGEHKAGKLGAAQR